MPPFKRVRQPKMTTQALLDFDLGESSSDSDFRIEDFHDLHDDDDDDDEEDASGDDSGDEESSDASEVDTDDSTQQLKQLLAADMDGQPIAGAGGDALEAMLKKLDSLKKEEPKLPTKPICCVCLGERSDDTNEIIECDGCGVSVHEGCYGVSDSVSISSTNSTCSTEPWFCEACRAGVTEPICELCPNKGGIYKETDVGKWVHLVCALYVPGVAFGEVDQLSSVTLFEMPYSKWGGKLCMLCEDPRFARTGVCIGCDAGMCKTYFHVTCAQSAGFLTEAHHEDAEAADPFYAHCKVHSEKEIMKKRRRNYHSFRLNMQQKQKENLALKRDDPSPAQMRIQRKLLKYQCKYASHKQLKMQPWVPTQKMSRLLTTSASACKRLLSKADTMSVDVELLERQESQIASLTDIRKKWHIAPAFSVEFIGYYLDRISRTKELKQQLGEMMHSNGILTKEQDMLRKDYDAQLEENNDLKEKQDTLLSTITQLHKQLTTLCPNKLLPNPANIGRAQPEPAKTSTPPTRPISVPTAAALKMGVGFPLGHLGPPGTPGPPRLLSTHAKNSPSTTAGTISAPSTPPMGVQTFDCGICKRCNDQHLLAKCDTCQQHYHLGCLNPPLTRHPKKSKLYGWQCSECDKSDDSDAIAEMPKGPRKSRTRFNKDGSIIPIKSEDKLSKITTKRHTIDGSEPTKTSDVKERVNRSSMDAPYSASTRGTPKKAKLSLSPNTVKDSTVPTVKPALSKSKKESNSVIVVPHDEPLLVDVSQTSNPRIIVDLTQGDMDPLALPVGTNNLNVINLDDAKQARKQKRKDRMKSKHNVFSDKERKHKRKKRMHDHDGENPNDSGIIKIKFKTLPKPGEETPEAHYHYVPADAVRSAEEASRPTSVETVEDLIPLMEEIPIAVELIAAPNTNPLQTPSSKVNKKAPVRKISPRQANQRNLKNARRKKALFSTRPLVNLNCCVCREVGTSSNVVTCDECRKNYHFTCLDPPLKKTPKIRGYSWHCADCDPTEDDVK